MKQTDTQSTPKHSISMANWTLLAAAMIAWTGLVIHIVVLLDFGMVEPGSLLSWIALGAILIGIASGIANIGYYARTENLSRQWLLIGVQLFAGLIAHYLSEINTPAMMLIIGMAQVPARTGTTAIGAVFAATNMALGGILLTIESTTTQALVVWFLFVGFQLFALTVAVAQQRERLARESLAAANAELIATRSLVANSARIKERLRVSRELHDIAGHTLTAIKVRLEAHSRKAPDDLRAKLLATRDLAQELLDDIRAVVSHLRQHDPVRIKDELRGMCDRFPNVTIHVSIDEALQFDRTEQVTTVLRCVQEAITNAIRHGGAKNIWISLEDNETEVELTVRDDGAGGVDYEPGYGLRGIDERLAAVGGRLQVQPTVSEGWALSMQLPSSVERPSQSVK